MAVTHNKRVMRKFYKAEAFSASKAVTAEKMGLQDNMIMDRFVKAGFLVREGEGFYIPESFRQTQRWSMMFGKSAKK